MFQASIAITFFKATDKELADAVEAALEAGYRHIDTAHVYENEKVIGDVLKKWFDAGKLKRTYFSKQQLLCATETRSKKKLMVFSSFVF